MRMEDDGWVDRVMLVTFILGLWALTMQLTGGE